MLSRVLKSILLNEDRMKRRGITTPEAGEYVGCSAAALRAWRKSGRGPRFFRAGRLIRYRIQDLDEWIALHLHPDGVSRGSAEDRRPEKAGTKV
jgi:predicted DNA-binding transcriptional regulator AlpA